MFHCVRNDNSKFSKTRKGEKINRFTLIGVVVVNFFEIDKTFPDFMHICGRLIVSFAVNFCQKNIPKN
jgi:hypothetical protein